MIEIFRTNISDSATAQRIIADLLTRRPELDVSIDLDDCDRVLRIVSPLETIDPKEVIGLVEETGHEARILEDESA